MSRTGWVIAIAIAMGAMALSGCGGSSAESSSSHAANQAKKKAAAETQQYHDASRPLSDMVAAVSASKVGPPVEVKFDLRDLPQTGQPLDVDIAVLPDGPSISRVYAKFQGGESLPVVEGAELAEVEKPAAGAVIRHVVRVVPKADGIFALSATISVDLVNDSLTRTFSIPVIVGEGLPEPTAKAEVADGQSGSGTVARTH
jgi:hypothetical protein